MLDWEPGEVRAVAVTGVGEQYRRYRLPDAASEAELARSLERWGQLTPLVVCLRRAMPEVVDGFKRLSAARLLGLATLNARLLEADERAVKAAIYGLNCVGRRTRDWEEAWLVHALIRDDGLTQPQVAELLGRHKSWVCRRLALVEKLAQTARADLCLGLLSPTAARALVRLPAGNQADLLATMRRADLTAAELDEVIDLFLASTAQTQQDYLLANPRQALAQAHQERGWAHDPRLSVAGNRVARRLHSVLEGLARLESWLVQRGRAELTMTDRCVLTPAWRRLAQDSASVAVLTKDFLGEEAAHDRATA